MHRRLRVVASLAGIAAVVALGSVAATTATAAPTGSGTASFDPRPDPRVVNLDSKPAYNQKTAYNQEIWGTVAPNIGRLYVWSYPGGDHIDSVAENTPVRIDYAKRGGPYAQGPYGSGNCYDHISGYGGPDGWVHDNFVWTGGDTCARFGN